MAAFVKFEPFVENLAEKAFNLGSDTITVALSATAPTTTWGTLSQVTQVSYTNLSARVVTISASSQTNGIYAAVASDLTLTASGGAVATFRYPILYDDTAASDQLIGFYDYGSSVTLADGETFTLDFGASALTIA